jgi:hypothetical protein
MSANARPTRPLAWLAPLTCVLAVVLCLPAVTRADPSTFGAASFTTSFSTTQAGAHPDFTFGFQVNLDAESNPIEKLRDVRATLPAGLIGNTLTTPRCTAEQFQLFGCLPSAQIGFILMYFDIPEVNAPIPIALYNLTPMNKHLATFAGSFLFAKVVIQVDLSPSDQLVVTVEDLPTIIPIDGTTITIWGVPAANEHDEQRWRTQTGGPVPIYGEPENEGEERPVIGIEPTPADSPPTPFLTSATNCSSGPQQSMLELDSYQKPGEFIPAATSTTAALTGCDQLHFDPSIKVEPDTTQRDTPSGYDIDLQSPLDEGAFDLATPNLQSLSITLPAGTSLSPAVGVGLAGCADAQFAEVACPDASKVGSVTVSTPLLAEQLTGSIYIGSPTPQAMYRIFIHAAAKHVSINLSGVANPDPLTGQLTILFQDMPQLPFSEMQLHVFGGPQAAFSNPVACGPASASSLVTSYGGQQVSPSSAPFTVDDNGLHGACPATQSFAPSFQAGTTSPSAGHDSPLEVTVSRSDGQQSLHTISLSLPPGLLAKLSSAPQCPDEQATAGSCPAATEVGTAAIGAGAGAHPLWASGHVFLTGPYEGAPFGLSIVVPAIAGPFNLGEIVIRAKVLVDPHDLHITIASDPIPTIRSGIPLRVQTVHLSISRPGFIFNPTNCAARSIGGTFTSWEGASSSSSTPFQIAGCSGLPFKPGLKISSHSYSKANGAPLDLTLSSTPGQADVSSVVVQLPKQLQARLSTLQKACLLPIYEANPRSCPAESVMGQASILTPVLKSAMTGPIYLVSRGRSGSATLSMTLQAEGVSVDLTGTIGISAKNITSSSFTGLPDAPITTFSLHLAHGPHSLLGPNGSVCDAKLVMPTTITAQSGRRTKRNATISVGGCPKRKPAKKPKKVKKKAKPHKGKGKS